MIPKRQTHYVCLDDDDSSRSKNNVYIAEHDRHNKHTNTIFFFENDFKFEFS